MPIAPPQAAGHRTDECRHREQLPRGPQAPISVNWVDHRTQPELWGHPATTSSVAERVARFGFASIFIVNGLIALINPDEFSTLLADNAVGALLSDSARSAAILLAAINDLLLGLALLVVSKLHRVMQWAAVWLAIVAATKAMNLIW